MTDAKAVSRRVNRLEDTLEEWKIRFSEEHMVELLGKALKRDEHHIKLDRIKQAIYIGFVSQTLMIIFAIVLLITFAE